MNLGEKSRRNHESDWGKNDTGIMNIKIQMIPPATPDSGHLEFTSPERQRRGTRVP